MESFKVVWWLRLAIERLYLWLEMMLMAYCLQVMLSKAPYYWLVEQLVEPYYSLGHLLQVSY